MKERVNLNQLDAEELEKVQKGGLAEVMQKRQAEPQQPFGQPMEIPQERKPEVLKKHDKRDGRR